MTILRQLRYNNGARISASPVFFMPGNIQMALDKKSKKKLEVLRKRLDKTRQLLTFAKQQTDEPDEVERIQNQIRDIEAEIEELKKG